MKTAVLFETFARPDYAIQTFSQIKKARPPKFYFYSNKAREDRPDEIERNNQIRALIDEIDWPCEIHTFFRDEYVDVYTSLQGAMDWVFENENQAIVMEEDCVASPAFFEYCDYFLEKYENEPQIGFITGDNYLKEYDAQGADHIINRMYFMYGWATWRDRWQNTNFKVKVDEYLRGSYIEKYYQDERMVKFWRKYFINLKEFQDRTNCWDYAFGMNCVMKGLYGVAPIVNLVQNVGVIGEHSNGESGSNSFKSIYEGEHYPFKGSNLEIVPDDEFDHICFERFFGYTMSLSFRIIALLKKITRNVVGEKFYLKIRKKYKHINR